MITRQTPEQRVILHNVGWETYETLREEREERRSPRFFYDRGELEILSPSAEHESTSDVIASLIKELAVALGIDVYAAGSTTFARQDLAGGFEPDECFYFGEKARLVRGTSRIDLDAGDPPPDLVVEVDLTSPSLAKLPVYARVGVQELWRYADGRLEILGLGESGEGYEPLTRSAVLKSGSEGPMAGELGRFVKDGTRESYPEWVRSVRQWAAGADF